MSPQPIPKRAVVIDDDPMSRDLLVVLLEGEGYAAESTDSGESALDLVRHSESAPDLVLADVQLPGICGAPLARKLRRACGPTTILLAMSGSQPPAKAIALFDGFLLKPFKMEQVAAAISARKNQPAAPHARPSESAAADPTGTGPVLDETIYGQLASSIPAPQLQEMYSMCVNDARKRIAGMRKLAAAHDDARFMREAHAIKGGCGMLGATELHRMAARLEAGGPGAAAPGGAQDVNSLDELSAACDRLERMLGSRV
jgi:CheY-like chemotaxis protein